METFFGDYEDENFTENVQNFTEEGGKLIHLFLKGYFKTIKIFLLK